MSFDLTQVMQNAAKVAEQSSGDKNQFQHKLVYPQDGTLKVRLIFNQPSGLVMRKIERHKVNNKQVACLQQYGQECPVCKALNDINNAKGVDLWQFNRNTRGIAYAEYVDSDYKWNDPKYHPKAGEIVLLMFPWTIYSELNKLITAAGDHLYSLIASNVGGVFNIKRWREGNQTKYRAEIDPYDHNHRTCDRDEDYEKLITESPSLNERFIPIEMDEATLNAAKLAAEELTRDYLSPAVVQPNLGQPASPISQGFNPQPTTPQATTAPQQYTDPTTGITYVLQGNQYVPVNSNPTPAPPLAPTPTAPSQPSALPPNITSNQPACYGKHGSVDANQCLVCPSEVTCVDASKFF